MTTQELVQTLHSLVTTKHETNDAYSEALIKAVQEIRPLAFSCSSREHGSIYTCDEAPAYTVKVVTRLGRYVVWRDNERLANFTALDRAKGFISALLVLQACETLAVR